MKFSDNRFFKKEFAKLDVFRALGCSMGSRPFNNLKNRFANLPTYDKTRVILEDGGTKPGLDYINANYVDGFDGPNGYIATQAPLPETIIDFWRMIWEKDINAIVMVGSTFIAQVVSTDPGGIISICICISCEFPKP